MNETNNPNNDPKRSIIRGFEFFDTKTMEDLGLPPTTFWCNLEVGVDGLAEMACKYYVPNYGAKSVVERLKKGYFCEYEDTKVKEITEPTELPVIGGSIFQTMNPTLLNGTPTKDRLYQIISGDGTVRYERNGKDAFAIEEN